MLGVDPLSGLVADEELCQLPSSCSAHLVAPQLASPASCISGVHGPACSGYSCCCLHALAPPALYQSMRLLSRRCAADGRLFAGGSDCTVPLWGAPGGWPQHLAPLAPFLHDPVPASFPGLDGGPDGGLGLLACPAAGRLWPRMLFSLIP